MNSSLPPYPRHRFPDDFGKTIVGYFYDEPETPGDWGTEVPKMLAERGISVPVIHVPGCPPSPEGLIAATSNPRRSARLARSLQSSHASAAW